MRLEELERAEKMRLEELVKEQALKKEKELQLKFDLERFKIESGFRDNWANLKSATQIAELFDNYEDVRKAIISLPVEILNAVQTRSQVKAAREERGIDSGDAKKGEDEVIIVSSDAEDEILIPALQEYVPELALLRSNPVERFHRTLKRLLRVLCLDAGSEWDKHLPSILLALRTVSHESTGYTPSELVYGKNLRTPETLVMEHWMEPEEEGDLVTEYMFKLINRLKRCQEVAINKWRKCKLSGKLGYWQIPLSKTAQRYAAFCTSFGTYRPLRMSFGLKNAPYFFSKLMAELLNGLKDFVVPYLDDIAIFSDTWESHIKHMETVLQRIKRAKLTIKPSKCKFAQQNVKFLGHIVGQGFRTPSEIKVQAVLEFPTLARKPKYVLS
ncbi:hypothetical protein TNCV_3896721 [Trichonephila clavipes]|nr:hypothetical protein TNCV_3896721 [Trichonephila clavipes]